MHFENKKGQAMQQSLALITLVVRDYDEAIQFYTKQLGFDLIEDTYQPEQGKRWVVVKPKGDGSCSILLGQASDDRQLDRIGDQTGGRVSLFLQTDDFDRDYSNYKAKGVEFVRDPKTETYGKVAVFADLYGNLWDLIQFSKTSA
ncbi:MAG: catechol 2,3-dioxygenase-like lactoylglutathione lyase family enzyme [Ascidiaceihabitans sp.]